MVGNRIVVQEAILESGDGTLTATGTVNLTELTLGEFDLALRADNFLATDSREYRAVADATLQLSGSTQRPVLTGAVELRSAEINLIEQTTSPDLEVVELTEEDLRILEQRFGLRVTEADTTTFDFYEALAMDLDVEMERNTWLRARSNPRMDIQFSGSLDLTKQPFQDIQIFGSIEVVPEHSRIVQLGKQFNLSSGTLTFNGPAVDPYINIEAEYAVPARGSQQSEVVITLSVDGRMQDRLDVQLGSRNPSGLEMTDVLSYLATGRPASQALELGSAAQALAMDQIAGLLEGFAGARLGLDVVEIEQLGLEGTTVLTAGKYVTPRLFVSVSQPVSFGGDAGGGTGGTTEAARSIITVEYEIVNWLLLRLLRRGSVLHVNLLWEYAY
jgi:translocation and assembly module TamB